MHPGIHARKFPEKPAYIMASSGEVVTYQQLDRLSNQTAHLFRQYSLKSKDGVVVFLENHPRFFVVCWAAQRSGLYFTPISTQFQAEEVRYIANDCDASVLVTSEKCWPLIESIRQQLPKIKTIILLPNGTDSDSTQSLPDDVVLWSQAIAGLPSTPLEDECEGAEMFYSSGTTGRPKGVKLPHNGGPLGTMPEMYKKRVKLHNVTDQARYLSTAPLYHSAPVRYNMMMMREGATSIILEKFDAEESLRIIEKYQITHSQWVPTMFVRLLKMPEQIRQKYDLSSLVMAIHAAAPCAIPIKEKMIAWWGSIICEYYSGSEANGATAINTEEWLSHRGSVGRPIMGEVHILDDEGNELEPGSTGSVYFSGGTEFQYHKDPEKTAATRNSKGWSTIGDIGYLDADGYLYLTDRKAFTIISGGVNIYPQEVENLLIDHPKVADVAVFGIPNDEFGEEVKAVVQPISMGSAGIQLEQELIDYCRAHLAHLKCPRSIDFEKQLPRHPTGKLYKRLLKDRYWTAG